jgi:hypothetical protein
VLNACYSSAQAEAIAHHVAYVVGMSDAIGDDAAIAFSVGFYQAIGAGRSIEEAFDLGCTQLQLQNIPDQSVPQLLRRRDLTEGREKRIIPMPGGTVTLLRKGRTVSEDPLDRQRIGFAAFMDQAHTWELVVVIAGSGDPWQSAQVTAAAAQVLRVAFVETILPELPEHPATARSLFEACVLSADMGVRAAIQSMSLPEGIGAKMALIFRVGETIYAAYVGGCGVLAMWGGADGERIIRQLNLRTKLTIDLGSPAVIETPLGHLLLEGDADIKLEAFGSSDMLEVKPEVVPLHETEDFLILTSYALPSSDAGRLELAEHVAKLRHAENVSAFLIERDLPEESMVVCYSWDRPLGQQNADKTSGTE